MALGLARIAEQPQQKSRAIEILLDEAAQLTDRETLCPALLSLKSFEPLAVIPSLIAFLGKTDDGPVRVVAFETLEHLILHGFAAYDSDPAAARRGRDLTLRFFVAILGATALDEPERVMVAGIVLRCAEILASGLDAVIGRMRNYRTSPSKRWGCGSAAECWRVPILMRQSVPRRQAGFSGICQASTLQSPSAHSLRNPRPLCRAKVQLSLLERPFILV